MSSIFDRERTNELLLKRRNQSVGSLIENVSPWRVVSHTIFNGPRIRLEPQDQVDYLLAVAVAHPQGIDLSYRSIGIKLFAECETPEGKALRLRESPHLSFRERIAA